MKKSFLIVGLIAGLTATNSWAVQSGTLKVTCTCPEAPGQWCTCIDRIVNGEQNFYCDCTPNAPAQTPNINIVDITTTGGDNSVIQQSQIKPVKQKKINGVSARAAEMPKVTKKIVYEEIISDDDAE